MILTTNRVDVIDPAFRSRVHLAIKYEELAPESRSQLWQTFIKIACQNTTPTWPTEDTLVPLSQLEINGRQMKNSVRIACSLTAAEERELNLETIKMVVESMITFDRHFEKDERAMVRGGRSRSTSPLAEGGRKRRRRE